MSEAYFTADAPGRVNLIGEHTDYNGGFVLPSAIPQRTKVRLTARNDRRVSGLSHSLGGHDSRFEYELGSEKRHGVWWDYIQGVLFALQKDADLSRGLRGFDLEITSNVPVGSGLSSSAALEVALLRALRLAFGLSLDDIAIAKLGQRAENDFVGARVGIMDQMAASLADDGTALFIDTRSLRYRKVALPRGCELIVIDSGIAHQHAGGDYNRRRAECEAAGQELGVRELRDLFDPQAGDAGDGLKRFLDSPRFRALPETLRRRVRHVVTENERVLETVAALEADQPARVGKLFIESHRSMRDDYEVSVPGVDRLVELACATTGVYGARLTGGGFGGSIVALARAGEARPAAQAIAAAFCKETQGNPKILVPVTPLANPKE